MTDAAPAAAPAREVELGLGLVSLGRSWGHRPPPIPSDAGAERFVLGAIARGVRVLDTAPAYGTSEERLGRVLRALPSNRRAELRVATKCGEHWDASAARTWVDHAYDALAASVERSLERLGRVDVLQVHKSTADVLRRADVRRALDRARALGVAQLGASVTDVAAAEVALGELGVQWLQFPYHRDDAHMAAAFSLAERAGARVLVNRPLAMGRLLHERSPALPRRAVVEEALAFVLAQPFDGAILVGTRSLSHLAENLASFAAVRRATRA